MDESWYEANRDAFTLALADRGYTLSEIKEFHCKVRETDRAKAFSVGDSVFIHADHPLCSDPVIREGVLNDYLVGKDDLYIVVINGNFLEAWALEHTPPS